MIYEYAISPSLCKDYSNLRFFLETFGMGEGRLFSDIPRNQWRIFAYTIIKESDNGQVEKKRLFKAAKKLYRKAVYYRKSVPEIDSEKWLDHALTAHQNHPFRAILTEH